MTKLGINYIFFISNHVISKPLKQATPMYCVDEECQNELLKILVVHC